MDLFKLTLCWEDRIHIVCKYAAIVCCLLLNLHVVIKCVDDLSFPTLFLLIHDYSYIILE